MSPIPNEMQPTMPFEPDTDVNGIMPEAVRRGEDLAREYMTNPDRFGADWPSATLNRKFREGQTAATAGQVTTPATEVQSDEEATRAAMKEAVRAAHEGAERARHEFGYDEAVVQPSGTYLAARALRGQVVDGRRKAARRNGR